jgi:putative FmdB family regulatory protein
MIHLKFYSKAVFSTGRYYQPRTNMPIYEYECTACSHQFEKLRKISDEPLTKCPECSEDTLRKLISKVAFRLKGTGWYETDFKTKPADAKAESTDSKSGEKSKTNSDAKPSTDKKESSSKESPSASSTSTETAKKSPTKTED